MNRQTKLLFSAVTVGIYAFLMFTAAGFFYSNYQEMLSTCSRFSYSDCRTNEAIVVSMISLKIGTIVFFLMGSFAWMTASYIGMRGARLRFVGRLP